jgi:hypothetical protein
MHKGLIILAAVIAAAYVIPTQHPSSSQSSSGQCGYDCLQASKVYRDLTNQIIRDQSWSR